MKLRILGCSGGIGGDLRTTSMLLDHDILIDAGTGVGDLTIDELSRIDHVFLTHSHLDHVTSIPFMVDSVGWMRDTAAYGACHRTHAGNSAPASIQLEVVARFHADTRRAEAVPALRGSRALGKTVDINGRKLTPLPANHVVPAIGYRLDSGRASLVFTGDTTTNDPLWAEVNKIENLRYLIIETAFCNRERELAIASKHLCPSMLADELKKLKRKAGCLYHAPETGRG